MLIDYDKTFPEAARALALDGARILACLSAWAHQQHDEPGAADEPGPSGRGIEATVIPNGVHAERFAAATAAADRAAWTAQLGRYVLAVGASSRARARSSCWRPTPG